MPANPYMERNDRKMKKARISRFSFAGFINPLKQNGKTFELKFYALLLSSSLIMIYASMMTGFAFLRTEPSQEYGILRQNNIPDKKAASLPAPPLSAVLSEKNTQTDIKIQNESKNTDKSAVSDTPKTNPDVTSGASDSEPQTDAAPVYAESAQTVPDKNLVTAGCGTVSLYNTSTGEVSEYSLEDYVTGTLLAEVPTSYSAEALKAQAIACRTYAVYKLLHSPQTGHDGGAQLCTSFAHCQAFTEKNSVSEERYAIAKKAVDDTAGIIMYYDKSPILAVFHSSSNKKTKSSADVWGGELAYLSAVETWESENPNIDISKQYTFSAAVFAEKMRGLDSELAACDDSTILSSVSVITSDDGKTTGIQICGKNISASKVSGALGLRSSDFSISLGDENVTVVSKGYGHGVGMSQYGAEDMAQKGFDCFKILAHYYTGINFGYVQ